MSIDASPCDDVCRARPRGPARPARGRAVGQRRIGPGPLRRDRRTQRPGAPRRVQSGNTPVTASGNGITLTTSASALLRNTLGFTGTPRQRRRPDDRDRAPRPRDHWQWTPTAQATIAPTGRSASPGRPTTSAASLIRAIVGGTAASAASARALRPSRRPSTARRSPPSTARASSGSKTACGHRLTRATIGVANRTLRCGTKVAVYYRGRTLIVPVIDRGPYANGADWDLTMATGKALGMTGTAHIGAVSLPRRPPRRPRRRHSSRRTLQPRSVAVGPVTPRARPGGRRRPRRRRRTAPPRPPRSARRRCGRPRPGRRPRRWRSSGAPRQGSRARTAAAILVPSAWAPVRPVSRAMIHARASDSQTRMSWWRATSRTARANSPKRPARHRTGAIGLDREDAVGVLELGQQQRQRRVRGGTDLVLEGVHPQLAARSGLGRGRRPAVGDPILSRGPTGSSADAAGRTRRRRSRSCRPRAPDRARDGSGTGHRRVGRGGRAAGAIGARRRPRGRSAGTAEIGGRSVPPPEPYSSAAARIRPVTWERRSASSVIRSGSGSRSSERRADHITLWSASTATEVAAAPAAPASSPTRATSGCSAPPGSKRRWSVSSAIARSIAAHTRGPSRVRSAARIRGASSSGARSSSASSHPLVRSSVCSSNASIGASATGRARRRRGGPVSIAVLYHEPQSTRSRKMQKFRRSQWPPR